MSFDSVGKIGAALVTVALVTTLVSHGNTPNVIRALGDSFSGALRAAQGG